jgi:hypothetical protein
MMDQKLTAIVSDLRKMSSEAAADWLMDRYPLGSSDWGEAITILPHLSWKKPDQLRLAHHYLSRLPFASAKPYEAFASFMKVSRLVSILRENAPTSAPDKELLEYHAGPALARAAKTPEDHDLVENFRSELKAR